MRATGCARVPETPAPPWPDAALSPCSAKATAITVMATAIPTFTRSFFVTPHVLPAADLKPPLTRPMTDMAALPCPRRPVERSAFDASGRSAMRWPRPCPISGPLTARQ